MELRSLGDAYVRDEFKRHKDADVNFVPVFMTEWTVSIYTQQGHIHIGRKRTRKRNITFRCVCNKYIMTDRTDQRNFSLSNSHSLSVNAPLRVRELD